MRMLAPRPAVRLLLALALLAVPLGAWTAAHRADAGGPAEQVVAQRLSGGEQVVQADRQPLSGAGVDRRGDLGRYRSVLLGLLVGIALLRVVWRCWGRHGSTVKAPRRGATFVEVARAPPGLRIV